MLRNRAISRKRTMPLTNDPNEDRGAHELMTAPQVTSSERMVEVSMRCSSKCAPCLGSADLKLIHVTGKGSQGACVPSAATLPQAFRSTSTDGRIAADLMVATKSRWLMKTSQRHHEQEKSITCIFQGLTASTARTQMHFQAASPNTCERRSNQTRRWAAHRIRNMSWLRPRHKGWLRDFLKNRQSLLPFPARAIILNSPSKPFLQPLLSQSCAIEKH